MPRVVDLTLPFKSGMPGIPQIPLYERFPARVTAVTVANEEQRAHLQRLGVEVAPDAPAAGHMNTAISLVSHLGTHIDAPRHFFATGAAVDELPLERLAGCPARVLDVSDRRDGAGINAADLERAGNTPAAGEVAVIRTAWTDRAWGRAEFWANTMYLDPSVGPWLAARGVAAVAMDCFPEKPFWRFTLEPHERGANHRAWLGAGIPMIQLLTNLGAVGARFTIVALPLKLAGADGAPARVIGLVE